MQQHGRPVPYSADFACRLGACEPAGEYRRCSLQASGFSASLRICAFCDVGNGDGGDDIADGNGAASERCDSGEASEAAADDSGKGSAAGARG